MLDVGCSYGIVSSFLRFGCSLEELVSFFDARAPRDFAACTAATRVWLNAARPTHDLRTVGIDCAANAIRFGREAGLLDMGIVRNLETEDLTPEEGAWVANCNLLVCTGAIGYVGAPTFRRLLEHFGRSQPAPYGPVAVMTILRMFDSAPIAQAFDEAGYTMKRVPGVVLPQRAFATPKEQQEIRRRLHARDIDTTDLEDRGALFAELYVAAPNNTLGDFLDSFASVDRPRPIFHQHVEVAGKLPATDSTPGTRPRVA